MDQNDPSYKVLRSEESWWGYQCIFCGRRKLIQNKYEAQSPGATQEAFNWLNENIQKVPKRSKLLDLIKDNK